MSGIFVTLDLRPTSEMMLLGDALIQALNRLSAAMEVGHSRDAAAQTAAAILGGNAKTLANDAPPFAPKKTDDRFDQSKAPSVGRPAADDRMFSPERNAIIRRDYPAGVSIDAIIAQCHALPGREITRTRIPIQASKLGARRQSDAPYVRVAPPKEAVASNDGRAPEITCPPAVGPAEPRPKIDLSRLQSLGVVIERKPAPQRVTSPQTVAPAKQQAPQPQSRMEAIAAVAHIQRAAVDPGEPISADFDQVRQWAAQRGLAFSSWDDLPAVNRKRDNLGLPTFKRRFALMGVRT